MSVPHLSRQHELPYDFFRFTPGGLNRLLGVAGFEDISLKTYGGICTFVHHQFSTLILESFAFFHPLRALLLVLNAPLSALSVLIDRILDRKGLLANGVLASAQKPPSNAGNA